MVAAMVERETSPMMEATAPVVRRLTPRDHYCPACHKYVTTSWAPEETPPRTFYTLGKCLTCRARRRFDVCDGRPAILYRAIVIDS